MSKRIILYYKGNFFQQLLTSNRLRQTSAYHNFGFNSVWQLTKSRINFNKNDELAIWFYAGYTNEDVKSICDFIKSLSVKKVYFFVEDVFRITCHVSNNYPLETHPIERYPSTVEAVELNIIKKIIDEVILPYEVFHCEYNCNLFKNKYQTEIKYFDWFVAEVIENHGYKDAEIDYAFDKKLCCFNLREDMYRSIIAILLQDEPDTVITLNYTINNHYFLNNQELPLAGFSKNFENKIKECYLKKDQTKLYWDAVVTNSPELKRKEITPIQQWDNIEKIKTTFITLVTETRFASPMPNFSEKTLKPILAFRPFILLAPPGTLNLLKNLGIQTFNKWWDESYDNELDHHKRLEMVYHLSMNILSKSNEALNEILTEMADILIHNRQILKTFSERMFELN